MNINSETNNTRNKGVIPALIAANVMKRTSAIPVRYLYGQLAKSASKIPAKDSEQLWNAINDAFVKSGMEKRNYKICTLKEQTPLNIGEKLKNIKNAFSDIDKTNIGRGILKAITSLYRYDEEDKEIIDTLTNNYMRSKRFKRMAAGTKKIFPESREIAENIVKRTAYRIKKGENAALIRGAKMILLPEKSMHTAAFHEMGHYMNYTHKMTNKITKLRSRMSYIPSAVLLLALLNNNDVNNKNNKENENILQKTHDGIKKHAGLIASLSLLPKLADEGMASVRGLKLAKQLVNQGKLSDSSYKKVIATNIVGFSSYITGMIITGLITNAAIKLKDNIQKKHEKSSATNSSDNFISDFIKIPDIFSNFKQITK